MYATTGMRGFDYLIGDEHVIPVEEEPYYSEKILRVPGSYLTFEVNYPVPPVADPPCLTKNAVTFGSLASQYKITNEVIAAWSRILEQSPNSSLIVKNAHLASPLSRRFVHSLFAKQGIGAERVLLEGPEEHYEFLKAYSRIDIVLDTFPYNGGTSTTEAIWQGVPVIAFQGDRWASRTSASILRAGGLDEFVARDLDGYVALAARWASVVRHLGTARRTPAHHAIETGGFTGLRRAPLRPRYGADLSDLLAPGRREFRRCALRITSADPFIPFCPLPLSVRFPNRRRAANHR